MGVPSAFGLAAERLGELRVADFFSIRMFGFASARAWVYLMFLGAGTSAITWDGSPVPPLMFILSTIFLCATLFVSAARPLTVARLAHDPWFITVGPTLSAAGTLFVASSCLDPALSMPMLVAGSVTTGVGSGIIDLCYGELYSSVDERKTPFEIPLSFLLAALAFPLVSALPDVVSCIVCTALPVASGIALAHETLQNEEESGQAASPERPKINIAVYTTKIGVCACLVGLADGVVRSIFVNGASIAFNIDLFSVPLPVSNALTLVVIYACVLLTRNRELRFVYRSVMFIMAVFFMLLPVFTGYSHVEGCLALTGYGTFNALIWIIIAGIAHRYRFSSAVVFGIGWGMVSMGTLLGHGAGTLLQEFAPFTPQALSLIALLATVGILLSYMFVFSESDLAKLAKTDESENAHRRRFYERCEEVAKAYALTPKETEVMTLYAKGRTSKHIQEELFISRGTVTTHLRHIYQKLGVHDKQELLDLIERRQG